MSGWRGEWGGMALVAAMGCGLALPNNPTQVSAGGSFSIQMSNVQGSNLVATSFDAKTVAGNYNSAEDPDAGGWNIATGLPNVLDTENQSCRGISLGFAGLPTSGQSIALFPKTASDGGLSVEPDGGAIDLTGLGVLTFQEGCIDKSQFSQWGATSGTVTIDSVGTSPSGSTPSPTTRQVKLHWTGVAFEGVPGTQGTGSFTANGSAQVDLWSGFTQ